MWKEIHFKWRLLSHDKFFLKGSLNFTGYTYRSYFKLFGKSRELSENVYFYPPLVYNFELWLFVLRHVTTSRNRLYTLPVPSLPPPSPTSPISIIDLSSCQACALARSWNDSTEMMMTHNWINTIIQIHSILYVVFLSLLYLQSLFVISPRSRKLRQKQNYMGNKLYSLKKQKLFWRKG